MTDLFEERIALTPAELDDNLATSRDRLRRLVALRVDHRIQGRVDSSDVVQETFMEASRRIGEYPVASGVPFFVWLRFLALQKLAELHRKHLGVKARDAAREVSLYRGPLPAATSAAIASRLVGQFTSPSEEAIKAESRALLEQALNAMDESDREVLCLRHFEQLSQRETAEVLGINEKTAGSRHVRALAKLRRAMNNVE